VKALETRIVARYALLGVSELLDFRYVKNITFRLGGLFGISVLLKKKIWIVLKENVLLSFFLAHRQQVTSSPVTHFESGADKSGSFEFIVTVGGIIRYQTTSASAAAWRGFTANTSASQRPDASWKSSPA